MAFGRLERTPASQPMSDINMTPLIDVMLVLLVIFMLTAPLMASSLKMELPRAKGATPNSASEALTLGVTADGRFFAGSDALTRDDLIRVLQASARREPVPDVVVRADRRVPYGRVAELIGLAQDAGLTHIGFVADPEAAPGSPGQPAHK
ncbi:MAG TPA: biopolymer transporter ExbD [Burkholderiaceae bacterium]|jgi:biopolymer transport protein ExbD|nr:biopolymer transporter ExbD [Burkholderiaceae bacterium]